MRMVRVLGVLPGFVGFVCIVLLTASLVGIEIDSTRVQATTVPCLEDDAGGCPVGMTGSDFHVPWGFSLIDVEVNIAWDEPEKAWIGVVDAKYAEEGNCPPNSNGLTSCEADDFEFVAGGPEDSDEFTFSLKPGDYRFTSGGRDGASLDNQLITITSTFHISQVGEILLGVIGILLMIGAVEMIYPIELFWKKYVKS